MRYQQTYTSPVGALVGRDHTIVTRQVDRAIRKTFPFLNLPPELRAIIYEFALETDSIQKILARYYEQIKDVVVEKDVAGIESPMIYRETPHLFRINRQIYLESVGLISKRAVTFDHGMLDLANLKDFARPSFWCNLGSITINDSGHKLVKPNMPGVSWIGYTLLITQLAEALAEGHKLKHFEISFVDADAMTHMNDCWDEEYRCGYRDTLKEALNKLRDVRNVGNVTFQGLPRTVMRELKARMESSPTSFLDLPRELRDTIYSYSADWSGISTQIKQNMENWGRRVRNPPRPFLKTPTILLLNRQITSEAEEVLQAKPLNLSLPKLCSNIRCVEQLKIEKFISLDTISQIQHLNLKIKTWGWLPLLTKLFECLAPTSHPDHDATSKLQSFTLHLPDDSNKRLWFRDKPLNEFDTLKQCLYALRKVRGLKTVTFSGDLPAYLTDPLEIAMLSPVGTSELVLPDLSNLHVYQEQEQESEQETEEF